MTVDELRAALAELPGDAVVEVRYPDEIGDVDDDLAAVETAEDKRDGSAGVVAVLVAQGSIPPPPHPQASRPIPGLPLPSFDRASLGLAQRHFIADRLFGPRGS